MNVRKTDAFLADLGRQYEWYVSQAGWEIADRYLNAVEAVCHLLSQHPTLGPLTQFSHPKLRTWRFLPALRPFGGHILFFEVLDGEVVLRRIMHGKRDLAHRLVEPPEET
ncbi:MAG TPA: type II toxin-antitoxin system RelE/ParE family toxin [Verrucomicrobiae bacterium]|jgi:plasmid stabilization system protein ParE